MRCGSKASSAFVLCFGFLVAACRETEWHGAAAPAPPTSERTLNAGVVEARIAGDETHAYLLYLDSGQYAGITVDQRGADVGLHLKDPEGKLLRSVDSPHGARVPEPLPVLRSEEHTSELQSQSNLVCRLLLEKK